MTGKRKTPPDNPAAVLKAMVSSILSTDRRIDNMEHIIGYQREKRGKTVDAMRVALGRSEVESTFIDFDARRDPKTDRYCVMCQKDLGIDQRTGSVRLVLRKGSAPHAVRNSDIALMDLGVLVIGDGDEDHGRVPIGLDCARRLGIDWYRIEAPASATKPN